MDSDRYAKLRDRIAYEKAARGDWTPEQIASADAVLAKYPGFQAASALRGETDALFAEFKDIWQEVLKPGAPDSDFVARCNEWLRRSKVNLRKRKESGAFAPAPSPEPPKTEAFKPAPVPRAKGQADGESRSPRKVLTVKGIENLTHGPKRREVPDGLISGLYLVLQPAPSTVKSWAYRPRINGRTVKITLGRYPKINLANVRKLAQEAELTIRQGKDPRQAKAGKAPTFGEYMDKHFERPERRGKDGDAELRRAVEFDCGDWRNVPLASIGRGAIKAKLDAALARSKAGSASTARKLYAGLKAIFQLGVDHEVLDESPVEKLTCPASNNERDRVLDDAELVHIWEAAQQIGYPYGTVIRLLILTGARRDEIAHARLEWLDLDKGTLTIPRAAMKTRAAHVIYLTPLMRDALAECRITTPSALLFTTNGLVPFSGWSAAKRQLDKLSGVTGWRQHDLRRTAKTNWQKLKIPYEVRQMMSAHAVPGVQGIYERHDWAAECRAGFKAWSACVRDLVIPPPENDVVPVSRAKADA